MAGGGGEERDAIAMEDAFALRVQLALTRVQPALDPRLRPFIDRARRALHDVRDEAGLDAALTELRPLLDALARWPRPPGAPSLNDARVLRFTAAFCALWALGRGEGGACGLEFARAAVALGRRGGLLSELAPDSGASP